MARDGGRVRKVSGRPGTGFDRRVEFQCYVGSQLLFFQIAAIKLISLCALMRF